MKTPLVTLLLAVPCFGQEPAQPADGPDPEEDAGRDTRQKAAGDPAFAKMHDLVGFKRLVGQ